MTSWRPWCPGVSHPLFGRLGSAAAFEQSDIEKILRPAEGALVFHQCVPTDQRESHIVSFGMTRGWWYLLDVEVISSSHVKARIFDFSYSLLATADAVSIDAQGAGTSILTRGTPGVDTLVYH